MAMDEDVYVEGMDALVRFIPAKDVDDNVVYIDRDEITSRMNKINMDIWSMGERVRFTNRILSDICNYLTRYNFLTIDRSWFWGLRSRLEDDLQEWRCK